MRFDADIGKVSQASTTAKKIATNKFSIPSTLQFSRVLWNLLLCMLSHSVTDFFATHTHSHYFYGDIRFFLFNFSTSINFMTYNCKLWWLWWWWCFWHSQFSELSLCVWLVSLMILGEAVGKLFLCANRNESHN